MKSEQRHLRVGVLGAGMVGSLVARDLAADPELEVTLVDRDPAALAAVPAVGDICCDLEDSGRLADLLPRFDLVVGALPGPLGRGMLEAAIEAGRPCCDISFMAEDVLDLDRAARERATPIVVDCGVAPGLSNILVGHACARLASVERVAIYVGGLPKDRGGLFEYKTPFSPIDVIAEYTRPARLVEAGEVVVREALSELEPLDFPGVGRLEAFNTDGLRTLLHTIDAPYRYEKTLRYPGHAQAIAALRDAGLFGEQPLAIEGCPAPVKPIDLTTALLFPQWRYRSGEADLTAMRVDVEGADDQGAVRYRWDLLDHYDPATDQRSMSRVTAFPCAIVTRLIAKGVIAEPGLHPPETLARDPAIVAEVLDGLEHRGVTIRAHVDRDS